MIHNIVAPSILNDPGLLTSRAGHFRRLERLFTEGGCDTPFLLNGFSGQGKADPYLEPELWVDQALEDLTGKISALADQRVFRPAVIEFGPWGVHFIDRIFGARVYHPEGGWWVNHLQSPIGELPVPDLDQSDTWQLAVRLANAFVAAEVSVPLFGLPTIGNALNIAMNLYGEQLLMEMYERPAAVHRDLRIINDVLCCLHRWYLEHLPLQQLQPVVAGWRTQPPGFGQICGCSTHLLSPESYAEFVAPLDDELLCVYPHGGMIHLCGAHLQHLPTWKAMKGLRSVQLNDRAADDLPKYLQGLRADQVIYLNPTAETTCKKAYQMTDGKRIVFVADTLN